MLLSIIIINYNTFELTCNCIRSIKNSVKIDYEIILIDNNSKECSPQRFLNEFEDLRLFALEENIGFGRANNFAVSQANGKYVLLLNSDTLVKENTIDETVNYLENNVEVDILGCKVITNGGVTQGTVIVYKGELNFFRSVIFFIKKNSVAREIIAFIYKLIQKRKEKKTDSGNKTSTDGISATEEIVPNLFNGKRIGALLGVFLLVKKTVYIESKGFDPDFFMYYEEIDWFLKRLRKYKAVYYPHVHIIHFFRKSDVYRKMSLQLHVSHYLFWYKLSLAHFVIYFLYNIVEIPSRLLMTILTLNRNYLRDLPIIIKAFPYALFDIVRYSNKYGSRKQMLKLKSLQKSGL